MSAKDDGEKERKRRSHTKPESFKEFTSNRMLNQWANLNEEERRERMRPAIEANIRRCAAKRVERLARELERTRAILEQDEE